MSGTQYTRLYEALKDLALAAEERENTMGDPCRLIEVKTNLERAAKNARQVIAQAEGENMLGCEGPCTAGLMPGESCEVCGRLCEESEESEATP